VATRAESQATWQPQVRQGGTVFPSRYQVGLAVVLSAIFLVALAPKLDTDLWWHLKDGAYIAAHGHPPTSDYLSFTFAGKPWTDHEWLSDLLLYVCYRVAGLWGTIVVFAGVICAAFGLVYTRMARAGANRILALFVLSGAFVASSATWGARPQMLTLLFLALYALVLDRWIASRDRRLLVVFPVAMLLWANLHGGWVLGLVFLTLGLAGEWLNRITRREGSLGATDLKALAVAIGLTLAATLANPSGLHEVLYPLVWIFPTAYSNVLTEWVSSDFHQPVTMVFEAMLLVLIASIFIGRRRVNWTHLIVILVFTHLALSEARNVAVWSIVVAPLLGVYLQSAIHTWPNARKTGERARNLRPSTERMLNLGLLTFAALLFAFEGFHFINAPALARGERSSFPRGAMQYMTAHRLPPRTFAAYAWGGYVLWKGYPRYRDFIDGRANTLFDTRILSDYLAAYGAEPRWRSVLASYHVQNVLLPPEAPLSQAMALDPAWHRLYRDATAVLYSLR
jgi:hypothetical protein